MTWWQDAGRGAGSKLGVQRPRQGPGGGEIGVARGVAACAPERPLHVPRQQPGDRPRCGHPRIDPAVTCCVRLPSVARAARPARAAMIDAARKQQGAERQKQSLHVFSVSDILSLLAELLSIRAPQVPAPSLGGLSISGGQE